VSFTIDNFLKFRPYLYHLTFRQNADRILSTHLLESASRLSSASIKKPSMREKRRDIVPIHIKGEEVLLRDQSPLYEKNMKLDDGWTFEDYLEHLNQHVFFWSGTEEGPNDYGRRYFEKLGYGSVLLRVETRSLFEQNPEPLFCRYNSGSPRYCAGKASPRGAMTFIPAQDAGFTAGEVVEVVYKNKINLDVKEIKRVNSLLLK
jgi:hypothetical protein